MGRVEGFGYLDFLAACDLANRAETAVVRRPAPPREECQPPKPKTAAVDTLPEMIGPPAPPELLPPPPVPCLPQGPYKIKLEQAVELALFNSREFQETRENLYLTALPVTLERFAFSTQFLAAGELLRRWAGDEAPAAPATSGRPTAPSAPASCSRPGLLLFRLVNQLTINLTGDTKPRVVSTSNATLELAQPFLRGGGRAVTLEPLTLAEHDLVYGIRAYARYRKQFYVAIAGGGDFGGSQTGSVGGEPGVNIAVRERPRPGRLGVLQRGRRRQFRRHQPRPGRHRRTRRRRKATCPPYSNQPCWKTTDRTSRPCKIFCDDFRRFWKGVTCRNSRWIRSNSRSSRAIQVCKTS